MSDKKQRIIKNKNNLKDYLSDTMLSMGEEKIETPLFTFGFRKSNQLVVDDPKLVPDKYKRIEEVEKIDKNLIKKDFKNGDVEGCHIEYIDNLQIK